VANSSVYKVLVNDMEGFERFMKRTKVEQDEQFSLPSELGDDGESPTKDPEAYF